MNVRVPDDNTASVFKQVSVILNYGETGCNFIEINIYNPFIEATQCRYRALLKVFNAETTQTITCLEVSRFPLLYTISMSYSSKKAAVYFNSNLTQNSCLNV